MAEENYPYLTEYKGVNFISTLATVEYIDTLEHFAIRDSDVFLVTYPKSGTIWMQQILSLIFNEGHRKGTEEINNISRVPWLEYNIFNMDYVNRPSPRLFSSHMPYYVMPKDLRNRRGKVIYVYRNPKDCLVSLYHFNNIMKGAQSKSWEDFFERFLAGKVCKERMQVVCKERRKREFGGSWFNHVRGWHTNKDDFNILFMTYEEMKKDLRSAVLKISAFVEKELDDEDVDTIVAKATFNNMKHDPLANYKFLDGDILDHSKGEFLRKGTVGDWKNLMTVAQNERFDQLYKEKMKDLAIEIVWKIE